MSWSGREGIHQMFSMLLTDSVLSALRLCLSPPLFLLASLSLSLKPPFLLLCELQTITVPKKISFRLMHNAFFFWFPHSVAT